MYQISGNESSCEDFIDDGTNELANITNESTDDKDFYDELLFQEFKVKHSRAMLSLASTGVALSVEYYMKY